MVEVASYANLRFIVGPGLDEVLQPGDRLVLVDEEYGDIYGDYIFLGYDTLAVSINPGYADLVGIASSLLVSEDGGVVVCGERPERCLALLAARMVVGEGLSVGEALGKSWAVLSKLYGKDCTTFPAELEAALRALGRLAAFPGWDKLRLVLSLASSYEYGKGGRFYGELVSWLAGLGAGREALAAALLSFLAFSRHGPPWEVFRYRLEAVGEANLLAALGGWVEEALAALRGYVEGRLSSDAALLAYMAALRPGDGLFRLVRLEDGRVTLYCSEPSGFSRECVKAAGEADSIASKAGLEEFRKPKLASGGPEPLTLCRS